MTGRADYFKPGDWNAACSMCGRKRKASDMVRNWQGQYRCLEHNEPRHPQDYVRGVPDNPTPPWIQPPTEDQFIPMCTLNGISAVITAAVVDCAMIDYVSPSYDPSIEEAE